MSTVRRAIKFAIFLPFVLSTSSEEFILGDVRMIKDILQIYFTTNSTTRSMDWVSVCYSPQIIKAVAYVACRQSGLVGPIRYGPGSQNDNRPYSFTHIKCATVSDYKTFGELHIMRCSLEGPILTPNGCQPISVECDSERLTQNPYKGQVSIQYAETGTLSDGIVEVFLGGKWSGICYNNNFPPNVADSICRQNGYTGHSSIEPTVDTGNRLLLLFSNYDCVQSSFACFSHCIANSLYNFKVCQDKIFLKCKFDTSAMLSNSSGSLSQCNLNSTSTNTHNSSCKYHSWLVVVAVILAVIIIILFANLFVCCYYFKFYNRNVNRNQRPPEERRIYRAINDDDQEALNNDQV